MISLPAALSVLLAFVAFEFGAAHSPVSVLLTLLAGVATYARGRIQIPLKALLPVALVLVVVFLGAPWEAPRHSTLILATAFPLGLLAASLLLILLLRRATPNEQLLTLFLGFVLLMLAGSTTQRFPYALLVVAHAAMATAALRQHMLTVTALDEASELGRPPEPGPLGLDLHRSPSTTPHRDPAAVPGWRARAAYGLAGCLAAFVGLGNIALLQWSDNGFNHLAELLETTSTTSGLFSPRSTLTSLGSSRTSQRVIARVLSADPPKHYIGRVYQTYRHNAWEAETASVAVEPLPESAALTQRPSSLATREGGVTFPHPALRYAYAARPESKPAGWKVTQIDELMLTADSASTYPSSRDALWIETSATGLQRADKDTSHAFYFAHPAAEGTWLRMGRGGSAEASQHDAPDAATLDRWLQLPSELEDETGYLHRVVHEVCGPCAPHPGQQPGGFASRVAETHDTAGDANLARLAATREANLAHAQALIRYFHEGYTYGTSTPICGEDPLETFLTERPAAHCEFFATALTLLLRAQGIPARYVNGFNVRAFNRQGGYWMVREGDAHAWVEACLDGTTWTTLDATPPGALEEAPDPYQDLRDRLDLLWSRYLEARKLLKGWNVAALRTWVIENLQELGRWAMQPLHLLSLLLLLALEQLFRGSDAPGRRWLDRRRRLRQQQAGKGAATIDGDLEQLHRMLERVEAKLERWGYPRGDGTTLLEQAEALGQDLDGGAPRDATPARPTGGRERSPLPAPAQAAARSFLLAYSAVRYQAAPVSSDALRELEEALERFEQASSAARGTQGRPSRGDRG